jgi:hypothetical protein
MKKLLTILATVTATVALAAGPAAAESTFDTGTYGPAEEPSLAVPLVIAFVVICALAAIIMSRSRTTD